MFCLLKKVMVVCSVCSRRRWSCVLFVQDGDSCVLFAEGGDGRVFCLLKKVMVVCSVC